MENCRLTVVEVMKNCRNLKPLCSKTDNLDELTMRNRGFSNSEKQLLPTMENLIFRVLPKQLSEFCPPIKQWFCFGFLIFIKENYGFA